jgi:hypothetical protein
LFWLTSKTANARVRGGVVVEAGLEVAKAAGSCVPSGGDLSLPLEPAELTAAARRAVYAYARSACLPAWDPPASNT